jgi:hypothetical protein
MSTSWRYGIAAGVVSILGVTVLLVMLGGVRGVFADGITLKPEALKTLNDSVVPAEPQPPGYRQVSKTVKGVWTTLYVTPPGRTLYVTDLCLARVDSMQGAPMVYLANGQPTVPGGKPFLVVPLPTGESQIVSFETPVEVPAGETLSAFVPAVPFNPGWEHMETLCMFHGYEQ